MTGRATLLAALVALSGGTHAAPAVPAGTCTVTLAKAHVFTGERFEVRDLAVRYGRLVAAAVAIASLAVPALARKPASAPTKTLMTRVDDRLKFDIDLTFPLEQFVRIYTYSEDKKAIIGLVWLHDREAEYFPRVFASWRPGAYGFAPDKAPFVTDQSWPGAKCIASFVHYDIKLDRLTDVGCFKRK